MTQKYFIIFIAFSILLLEACSNSISVEDSASPPVNFLEDSTFHDMLMISSMGKSVFLGTNDANAKVDERPQMRVDFDYDFSMDRHEVMCGEFNSLMSTGIGLRLDCELDSLPASNLTYYDAIVFANARSKKEGLDTAYTYKEIHLDDAHHCVGLDGLAFHPEVHAFRLPTEAEWMYVANLVWNTDNAWLASNSDYRAHEVCSAESSKNVPCDLVGNVMEWVNDWFSNFRDTVLVNYVGAPDGGGLDKRVVKGGSFRNDVASVKIHNRGDVYMVTSSTRAEYVGFRLAIGTISNAIWMGNDGTAMESRIVPISGSVAVRNYTGTYRNILVFRNDVTGNLAFIDYSLGSLTVVEIVDTLDVYHPDISPDGKRVAFCTGLEGVSGKSSVYVRDLKAAGSNLVRLDVESAAIPRWRVLPNGDTVIVYVSDAGNNKEDVNFLRSSTWQVRFANGKFGTPVKLFDGAYHGGVSANDSLAVTGARLLRVHLNGRDTVWYNGEQACNASLSKNGSNRTLFLDFGGNTGREFAQNTYGTHEMLLIADSLGHLEQAIPAPAGYSFDHTEWSRENLVVATLANADGVHSKVVLVNTVDGSSIELAEGDELWHPCLWVKNNVMSGEDILFDLDSAGAYLTEMHNTEQSRYRNKMGLFWKNLGETEVILVGSSRMEMGMNPDLFPERHMLNFGVTGIDFARDAYFVQNYALNHSDKLKAIVVALDLDGWRGIEDHLFLIQISGPGYMYDQNHNFWVDYLPERFAEAVENAYPADQADVESFSSRGGLFVPSQGWDPIEVLDDSVYSEVELQNLDARFDMLVQTIHKAQEKGIYVIGVIFPLSPRYRETGSFGTHGLRRSVAKKKIARLDSLDKAEDYFVLMDENRMGNHDYTDEMAYDNGHLSTVGANLLTRRLDSLLQKLGL